MRVGRNHPQPRVRSIHLLYPDDLSWAPTASSLLPDNWIEAFCHLLVSFASSIVRMLPQQGFAAGTKQTYSSPV